MQFLKSAVLPQDYPDMNRPEIAVAGRSNAGKSSFINALADSKVAKVSQNPGKTSLLNFFDFGQHYRFVDMPGYGWASRSIPEMEQWTKMIETYIASRENLVGLLLVMDLRRDWSEDEQLLKTFCDSVGKPMTVILTKADKSKAKEQNERKKIVQKASLLPTFLTSSTTEVGISEVEKFLFENWIKPWKVR